MPPSLYPVRRAQATLEATPEVLEVLEGSAAPAQPWVSMALPTGLVLSGLAPAPHKALISQPVQNHNLRSWKKCVHPITSSEMVGLISPGGSCSGAHTHTHTLVL